MDLLQSLTEAQREAVLHMDGPLMILAGPGSGKTRVVTHRIAHLLQQRVYARQILALTFTNKAAEEMQSRLAVLAPGERLWMSTFHRFCARLLREHAPLVGLEPNFAIYDTSDSHRALKRTLEGLDINSKHFSPDRIAAAISRAKNSMVTLDQITERTRNPLDQIVAQVYPAYQATLARSNAVDFDDLLLHVAVILRDSPEVRQQLDARYKYILVDEYQDTNLVQYRIVRALSVDYPNLAVTGDPDQSIYGWRGANLSNILDFEKDYPQVKIVRLEQNYRSTKRILRIADALISHNVRRKQKGLFTDNDEGQSVRLAAYATQRDEADNIAAMIDEGVRSGRYRPRDFAILYRTNALSRSLEFSLREHGIPYQMVNGVEFYQRKEIKDVLAYLALLNNPRDDIALLRVINTPTRGIGKSTIDRLIEHAGRKGATLLDAARESGIVPGLSTRSAVAVAKFVSMFDRLSLATSRPVQTIIEQVLNESGYRDSLKDSETEEDQERLANIEELLTAAEEFDHRTPTDGRLEEFLENVCLVNDTDAWEVDTDRVTLMTLHAAKGLEFPVVFIVALEERILPHERSLNDPAQREEERRLLFVGITRAQYELQLSLARYREFRGQHVITVPSSFLMELPRDEMEFIQQEASTPQWTEARLPVAAADLDDSFDYSETEFISKPAASYARPALTTAAEMTAATERPANGLEAEAVRQGMVVRHPLYGLGKIISTSGDGHNLRATVAFASDAGERTFVVAKSPLQAVRTA